MYASGQQLIQSFLQAFIRFHFEAAVKDNYIRSLTDGLKQDILLDARGVSLNLI